jgi:DNA-binding NarL/FixJ family response regulator
MAEFILNEKRILAVDDEPDVLAVLEEEIKEAWPNSRFDKASTYEEAVARMISLMYDVVILDIMGDRVEIPFFNQTGGERWFHKSRRFFLQPISAKTLFGPSYMLLIWHEVMMQRSLSYTLLNLCLKKLGL